ncbi:MAG: hypothetical protein PHH11_02380 [Methylomonas sp.]|nr:hypothetical protein [Methylomonas sp.]
MPDSTPTVFIFCALACEARALIDAWQLKKLSDGRHPFAIYADSQRVVVVTGIGKINMAGAVGYVMALFANPVMPVMLNLGIAGHRHFPLGGLVLGYKIIDSETRRAFYPQFPFTVTIPTQTVSTVSKPNVDYSDDGVFDMEASGFYEMAVKFSSSELIHVVKIISDNSGSPITAISEAQVAQWIAAQLGLFGDLLQALLAQSQQSRSQDSELYGQLVKEFRFTVSGCLKLKALLQRWRVLKGDAPLIWQSSRLKSGKAFLIWLEKQLDDAAFFL